MRLIQLKNIILLSALLGTATAQAASFNTAEVLRVAANSRSCLNYRITSQCVYVYISCNLFGCGIKTMLRDRIRHRLPDLVVTSFREPGQTPYTEIRNTASVAALQVLQAQQELLGTEIKGGYAAFGNAKGVTDDLTFNESNVIGSPVSNVVRDIYKYQVPAISGSPYLCPTKVTPLKPYFMSELDAIAWRSAELAIRPESLIPGQREIGNNLFKTWGSVHPRVGFVMQNQPPKAAAVVAQRAIDIVSQSNQLPHIYQSYPMANVSENTPAWQMISPRAASHCETFGAEGEWAADKQTESGEFAWNYWKEYECCKPGRGWLVFP